MTERCTFPLRNYVISCEIFVNSTNEINENFIFSETLYLLERDYTKFFFFNIIF